MKRYLQQLLDDITHATENIAQPYTGSDRDELFWISDEEEDRTAPRWPLEEWTGIRQQQLPPGELLSDDQVESLLKALVKLLDACNWSFVLQIQVPIRIQYKCIRENFNQVAIVKTRHMGFFELCHPGTPHRTCALGAYCHCRFFKEICANFVDENLSPAEERARALEIEVEHIMRRYGDEWMKYYPYHLDAKYDDANGSPYNYGAEINDDLDDEWR